MKEIAAVVFVFAIVVVVLVDLNPSSQVHTLIRLANQMKDKQSLLFLVHLWFLVHRTGVKEGIITTG